MKAGHQYPSIQNGFGEHETSDTQLRDAGKMRRYLSKLNIAVALSLVIGGQAGAALQEQPTSPQAPVRFAVISDPHLYDARLGTSGAAFQAYLAQDPKLLRESEAILDSAINTILQQDVKFLIISGDLTKDGELLDHIRMAQHLQKLEQRGVRTFVIPGRDTSDNS